MSKVLRGEGLESVRSWQPPSMDGTRAPNPSAYALPTAKQVEEMQRQAYQEAFEQGRREAYEATRVRLEALIAGIAAPLKELDDVCLEEIVTLTKSIARALVRRELKTEPGEIVAVVREAMSVLPSVARNVRLHLHPEDARIVREAMSLAEGEERAWRLVEDPSVERGGCRVLSDSSQIDASLETRLNAVVSRMLGGHRGDDGDV